MEVDVRKLIGIVGASMEIEVCEILSADRRSFEGIDLTEPVEVKARLTNKGEGRLCLTGRAKVTLTGECARCNTAVRQDLNVNLTAEYRPNCVPEITEDQSRPVDDESEIYAYCGHLVDLEQAVADRLLPSIPMRLLCSEDCRGLCPYCGANRNHADCRCAAERTMNNSPFGKLKNLLN